MKAPRIVVESKPGEIVAAKDDGGLALASDEIALGRKLFYSAKRSHQALLDFGDNMEEKYQFLGKGYVLNTQTGKFQKVGP